MRGVSDLAIAMRNPTKVERESVASQEALRLSKSPLKVKASLLLKILSVSLTLLGEGAKGGSPDSALCQFCLERSSGYSNQSE